MGRYDKSKVAKDRILHDTQKTIEAMSAAINAGKLTEALEIGEQHAAFAKKEPATAHFWFQLALVHRLLGNEHDADICWTEAKVCRDYTTAMEGDFLGDVALSYIRQGNTVDAQRLFQRIRGCYSGDFNRLAKLDFIIGRNKAAKGDYGHAVSDYQQALKRWASIGAKADQQWVLNCRIHLIRAFVLGGNRYAVKDIYRQVMSSSPPPNRKQRMLIRAARYGGKLGLQWAEYLA